MVQIVLVVRHPAALSCEYSLEFEVPALPRIGDCISVQRPDTRRLLGEDLHVRHIWWRLHHSDNGDGEGKLGGMTEVIVECDPAIGPYSSDAWRQRREGTPKIQHFDLSRIGVF